MRLTVLSSGSGGNCLLIEADGTRILVDAGLRPRKLRTRLQRFSSAHGSPSPGLPDGPAYAPAQAVFLTHEHSDHVCGAEELAAHGLALYATAGTAAGLSCLARPSGAGCPVVHEVQAGHAVTFQSLRVLPIALPHDAAEPVAYRIDSEHASVGLVTDCGHASPAVAAALAGCTALVLEANHDLRLLLDGPYPPFLKRRIAADAGHLSNEQSAQLLRLLLAHAAATAVAPPALVIAAHLSRTNNSPALVEAALRPALKGHPHTRLLITPADGGLPAQDVTPAPRRAAPATQLSLFGREAP